MFLNSMKNHAAASRPLLTVWNSQATFKEALIKSLLKSLIKSITTNRSFFRPALSRLLFR
jgi:hypothetical protein